MYFGGIKGSLFGFACLISYVAAVTHQIYEPPSIYPRAGNWSLTVDGKEVPVIAYDGYSYAHFSFGSGAARLRLTATKFGTISRSQIVTSPVKFGYDDSATTSGNSIGFTMENPHYMIVRLPSYREIVICADPLETNRPASSGDGIFNVVTQFGADKSGKSVSTNAFVNALRAANARGGGIVYVPPGVYPIGNLIIPSKISLYLAAGSALRFTGHRADYTNDWHKGSQSRDGTEWIRTAHNSADIKIYGRGTIDMNGEYAYKTGKFIAHGVVPMATSRFTFDGPIIRHSASWTLMVTRSNNVVINHAKVLNTMSMGENDAVDIVDSQQVVVKNSIGIAWDDSFSTKAQPMGQGITINYPGPNEPVRDVHFLNNLAWTGCYGFKIGQAAYGTQSNIRFEEGTVYRAAVGLGIHHKWGSGTIKGVEFTRMEIEHLDSENDKHQTWLAIFNQDGNMGVGAMSDISIWDIAVRDAGKTQAIIRGLPNAKVTNVSLRNIWFKDLNRSVRTLAEAKIKSEPSAVTSGVTLSQ
ncbi:pectin lyase fold/virulence factor [Crassisporium funariophilum]|nr:pectin lyase fold/virulence factor [Crassisporium funariophilum]